MDILITVQIGDKPEQVHTFKKDSAALSFLKNIQKNRDSDPYFLLAKTVSLIKTYERKVLLMDSRINLYESIITKLEQRKKQTTKIILGISNYTEKITITNKKT